MQLGPPIKLIRTPSILTPLHNVEIDLARLDTEHTTVSPETIADMASPLAGALDIGPYMRFTTPERFGYYRF